VHALGSTPTRVNSSPRDLTGESCSIIQACLPCCMNQSIIPCGIIQPCIPCGSSTLPARRKRPAGCMRHLRTLAYETSIYSPMHQNLLNFETFFSQKAPVQPGENLCGIGSGGFSSTRCIRRSVPAPRLPFDPT